jgi:hypothetical protein
MVGNNKGYYHQATGAPPAPLSRCIYICPNCEKPTYFEGDQQVPGAAYGNEVGHLPAEIASLYKEARNCMAVSSYTAAVLACRKLLMNVAVAQGAKEGDKFIAYVDHLASAGFVPPNARGWVDHIRKKSNEANHEIKLMGRADAEDLITFAEMLLKLVFEFPSRVPSTP